MKLIRNILFPVVPVYYSVTWLRNRLYDLGWKSSTVYQIPIICVGNLSVGGTGKTPTIEYLIRFLSQNYKVATLSRGYKRDSSGFIIADENATVTSIGDEPFQFYKKFQDVTVAVDADRRHGISELLKQKQLDLILLDDAFQHRKVKAGFNILLTSYDNLYCDDIVLPTGNLREPRSGAKRADLIVVTKCPGTISEEEKFTVINRLKPLPNQDVFFSSIVYSETVLNETGNIALSDLKDEFTLVTGIANPQPLEDYLKHKGLKFEHLKFKDHHNFSDEEISSLKRKKRILTTEKDYVRLQPYFQDNDTLFYLPIEFKIDQSEVFKNTINNYLKT
ncbi:tetraacyldisaccharide 4'-kinase [Psychroserpens ponticola]|uniref:Tetraacyldisaccharide 4'-kinase n=1 Tax=Psychroserpens ponticola TaxID=2932268 RepID=A0ABY7RYM4_9FLAO|nr:tetraacyldisaccharide 4'-kinase [Psychroserpens ponticola]WCO02229.1 tetraacyldisaccharide 4'-kinase [Psychroserpens ponticola]